MSSAFSAQIVGLSGLGQFNRIDLGKKLAGKAATLSNDFRQTFLKAVLAGWAVVCFAISARFFRWQ